jgi:hypothetical protein
MRQILHGSATTTEALRGCLVGHGICRDRCAADCARYGDARQVCPQGTPTSQDRNESISRLFTLALRNFIFQQRHAASQPGSCPRRFLSLFCVRLGRAISSARVADASIAKSIPAATIVAISRSVDVLRSLMSSGVTNSKAYRTLGRLIWIEARDRNDAYRLICRRKAIHNTT